MNEYTFYARNTKMIPITGKLIQNFLYQHTEGGKKVIISIDYEMEVDKIQ